MKPTYYIGIAIGVIIICLVVRMLHIDTIFYIPVAFLVAAIGFGLNGWRNSNSAHKNMAVIFTIIALWQIYLNLR